MDSINRTQRILDQIFPSILLHQQARKDGNQNGPFILGLTGLQGSGKSYLASAIVQLLNTKYNLNAIDVSLDDFYMCHSDQLLLRQNHPSFELLRVRGQPSTHDTSLARSFFDQLRLESNSDFWVPSFDKSLFGGDGDRLPSKEWRSISRQRPLDVLIFEGWCVGFRPLSEKDVTKKWRDAKAIRLENSQSIVSKDNQNVECQFSTTTIADHGIDELLFINSRLKKYCDEFMGPQHFNFMVHLDTNDLVHVYTWRMQQEHALRKAKGTGMTDIQVVKFVQRYMPAYELYLEGLKEGFYRHFDEQIENRVQLHILLDIDRNVAELEIISQNEI